MIVLVFLYTPIYFRSYCAVTTDIRLAIDRRHIFLLSETLCEPAAYREQVLGPSPRIRIHGRGKQ